MFKKTLTYEEQTQKKVINEIRDNIINQIKEKLTNIINQIKEKLTNINYNKHEYILAPFKNLFTKSNNNRINDGEIIKQINNVKLDATGKIDEDTFKIELIKQLKVHFTKQNYSFDDTDDLNKILTKLAKSYIIPKIKYIFDTDNKSIDAVIEKIKTENIKLKKIISDSYENVEFTNVSYVSYDNITQIKTDLSNKLTEITHNINSMEYNGPSDGS